MGSWHLGWPCFSRLPLADFAVRGLKSCRQASGRESAARAVDNSSAILFFSQLRANDVSSAFVTALLSLVWGCLAIVVGGQEAAVAQAPTQQPVKTAPSEAVRKAIERTASVREGSRGV